MVYMGTAIGHIHDYSVQLFKSIFPILFTRHPSVNSISLDFGIYFKSLYRWVIDIVNKQIPAAIKNYLYHNTILINCIDKIRNNVAKIN